MKKTAIAFALLGLAASAQVQAQYLYNTKGFLYTQNFNTLNTTGSGSVSGVGPHAISSTNLGNLGAGWTMSNFGGSSGNTEYRAQDGSQAGGSGRGVVSFGTTGSSDRALGTLATSNQISRFGFTLQNTTAEALTSFTLAFDGEWWRSGGDVGAPVTNTLAFEYGIFSSVPTINSTGFISVPSLNYTVTSNGTEAALNGNSGFTHFEQTLSGINWGAGQYLVLRWTGQDVGGQDNGLAVDNVSFRAVPEPTTSLLMAIGFGTFVFTMRRRIRRA